MVGGTLLHLRSVIHICYSGSYCEGGESLPVSCGHGSSSLSGSWSELNCSCQSGKQRMLRVAPAVARGAAVIRFECVKSELRSQ